MYVALGNNRGVISQTVMHARNDGSNAWIFQSARYNDCELFGGIDTQFPLVFSDVLLIVCH